MRLPTTFALFFILFQFGHKASGVEEIETPNYTLAITDPGFRIGITAGDRAVLPADARHGLSFLESPAEKSEKLSEKDGTTTYRVINTKAQTALVAITTKAHTVEVTITLESDKRGEISVRAACPGPSFGLGDHGGWEPNANLSTTQKVYNLRHNGSSRRFLSSFLIFPEQGFAGASFEKQGGSVSIGPDRYEMAKAATTKQTFYFYVGRMEEIYAAYRETRIDRGFPGVVPKMEGFELGWESWDLLKWKTTAATCQRSIGGFLDRGYPIRWAVTGSGFWEKDGTTVNFGRYDPVKYPDSDATAPPDFGNWAAKKRVRWMIGQRTNFVEVGGPHSSKPGESGASVFDTSPDSHEGIKLRYFLKNERGQIEKFTSKYYPTVPCYLLDGNAPGAAAWFSKLYLKWGAGGIKEDTMMAVPDHTIFNHPMRLISEGGALVMARCAAYSSPGTLTRVNDTFGSKSMTLRTPINYLQYAASAAPNVYSDTAGFASMRYPKSSVRHAWLLALTAGMSVSDSPWNHNWSVEDEAKFKKVVDLHYELGPYLHSAAVDSYATGYPHTMTPLPIAFPGDPATMELASKAKRQFEWMIGPSLLATPLLHSEYGKSNRMNIYLPAGEWVDFETGESHTGPTMLKGFEMPLGKTPLFVGGKGVFVSRKDTSSMEAVVFPIARDGSRYEFTFPDGKATCSVVNNNRGWDHSSLRVSDGAASVPFKFDMRTGAIRFSIKPGGRYELTGGK